MSGKGERRLLALASKERLVRILEKMLDESEFFSDHGIRSCVFVSLSIFDIQGDILSVCQSCTNNILGVWMFTDSVMKLAIGQVTRSRECLGGIRIGEVQFVSVVIQPNFWTNCDSYAQGLPRTFYSLKVCNVSTSIMAIVSRFVPFAPSTNNN